MTSPPRPSTRPGWCSWTRRPRTPGWTHGEDYARYILAGLIDALDRPHLPPEAPSSTLLRIARGILDSISVVSDDERREFCEADLETADVVAQVERFADFAIQDGRYDDRDLDVIRAFLYLLPPDRRRKSRVMKWLRCEELTPADRALLGGLTALTGDGAALRVIAGIGRTAFAALAAPLVLLADQIEEVFDVHLDEHESGRRFRQAVDTLVNIAAHVPTAVVVVACLDTHYQAFRQKLPEPKLHRLEKETPPVVLKPNRDLPELEDILGLRLRGVCERAAAPFDPRAPLFPFARSDLAPLAGSSIRKFLLSVLEHQRLCAGRGEWVKPDWVGGKGDDEPPPTGWEQRWNDFRNAFKSPVLDDEENLALLLAFAVTTTSAEMPDGVFFGAKADGHLIEAEVHPGGNAVDPLYVAVCDKSTRGGGLANQLEKLVRRVKDIPTVVVRSTPFPTPPRNRRRRSSWRRSSSPKGWVAKSR